MEKTCSFSNFFCWEIENSFDVICPQQNEDASNGLVGFQSDYIEGIIHFSRPFHQPECKNLEFASNRFERVAVDRKDRPSVSCDHWRLPLWNPKMRTKLWKTNFLQEHAKYFELKHFIVRQQLTRWRGKTNPWVRRDAERKSHLIREGHRVLRSNRPFSPKGFAPHVLLNHDIQQTNVASPGSFFLTYPRSRESQTIPSHHQQMRRESTKS